MVHACRLQTVIDSPEAAIVKHLQDARKSHILLKASLEDCSSVYISELTPYKPTSQDMLTLPQGSDGFIYELYK
jgi:hypothetical protein